MKYSLVLYALAATALAGPAGVHSPSLHRRKFGTANDFVEGGCKGVVMVYARASTEIGNIVRPYTSPFLIREIDVEQGESCGPILQAKLKAAYKNDFAMQGVDYPADLGSNFQKAGSNAKAINTMASLLQQVASKCPKAKIAAGGYR
jgi:cutinase